MPATHSKIIGTLGELLIRRGGKMVRMHPVDLFYSPSQPRAADGKWAKGGGGSGAGGLLAAAGGGPLRDILASHFPDGDIGGTKDWPKKIGTAERQIEDSLKDRHGYDVEMSIEEFDSGDADDPEGYPAYEDWKVKDITSGIEYRAYVSTDGDYFLDNLDDMPPTLAEHDRLVDQGKTIIRELVGPDVEISTAVMDRIREETADSEAAMGTVSVYQALDNPAYYNIAKSRISAELMASFEAAGMDVGIESDSSTEYTLSIRDAEGRVAGSARRKFFIDDNNELVVSHEVFTVAGAAQGQGIGSKFLQASEDAYEKMGVSRIDVNANIDVGGYAWARLGFDFSSPSEEMVMDYVDGLANYNTDKPAYQSEVASLRSRVEDGDVISAFEISQFGRSPGDTIWPGKGVMLGSTWDGSKYLSGGDSYSASDAELVELFYSPGQPRAADGKWSKSGTAARKAAYIARGNSPETAREQVKYENARNAERVRVEALREIPIEAGEITLPAYIVDPIGAARVMGLGDALSHDYPEVHEAAGQAIAGHVARFTGAVISDVYPGQGSVQFNGQIVDEFGSTLGGFQREVVDYDGSLAITHNHFQMNGSQQNAGIGSKFLKDSEDAYAAMGGAQVQLQANIDVGGYAWARLGFDFMGPEDGFKVVGAIAEDYLSQGQEIPAELRAASDRIKAAVNGEGSAPTAFELSQWGRTEGAKDWPGKRAMLGSSWDGYKMIEGD